MLHAVIEYIKYYFRAQTKYRVHAPSLFKFVMEVLEDQRVYYSFGKIEGVRAKNLQNHKPIKVEDLGAGSKYSESSTRKISQIARTAVSNLKKCKLLYRTAKFYNSNAILELGTSLGISTAYLAQIAKTTSIEGSEAIAEVAQSNFKQLGLEIDLRKGNIDSVLAQLTHEGKRFDLVVVDGNHRKEPTLAYFHEILYLLKSPGVIIFDDIYWSEEMTEAWSEIIKDPRVTRSIDLYTFGIVEIGTFNQGGHHTLIASKLKPFQFGFLSTNRRED